MASAASARLPRYNRREARAYSGPRYTVGREDAPLTVYPMGPPTGDERLTGRDAELASRVAAAPEAIVYPNGPRAVEPAVAAAATPARPPTRYEQAVERLRGLMGTPAADENGRLVSGAMMAGRGASEGAQSGSLGMTAGRALGGLLTGLFRPKSDEEIGRAGELQKAQQGVQLEGALGKEAREAELQGAQTDLAKANAEKARRPPPVKPVYKKQGGITYMVDGETATPIIGPNGEALAPDYQRPVYIDVLGDDGVTVERQQYNPQTQKYEKPALAGGAPAVVKRVERVNTDTGMKESDEVAHEDREAGLKSREQIAKENRESRERIAQFQTRSREQIAAASRAVQRDRLKMSGEQFSARYPGAGKSLSKDYIIKQARDLGMILEDAAREAIKQGYTIED